MNELSLTSLKGIGEKKEEAFNHFGIYNQKDLIEYLPRTYEDYGYYKKITDCKDGEKALIRCRLEKAYRPRKVRNNLTIAKMKFECEGSIFDATFFNNRFISSSLKEGKEYKLYGKVSKNGDKFEMGAPVYAPVEDDIVMREGYNPVYPLSTKEKLTAKDFKRAIAQALTFCEVDDPLSSLIQEEYGLITLDEAYRKLHMPTSKKDIERAARRLDFDEFAAFNFSIAINKNLNAEKEGAKFEILEEIKKEFLELLPFDLTGAQQRVLNDIDEDLVSGVQMNRLVQGDVGSGKTVVAQYALYAAVKNGYQGVFAAPTRLLASQHYESFVKIFKRSGIKIELLNSKMSYLEKKEACSRVESGESNIIIGTHSVFSERVKYKNLGLAVIDEQHRFGAKQRGFIGKKGDNVHTLVMSATPIPRTLTLSIYKDLDVSTIDEKPKGRKEIKTFHRDMSSYDKIYKFAVREIDDGAQVYVVCPSIDSSDLEAVEETYSRLKKTYFKGKKTAMIHGKMNEDEKDEIMTLFYNGEIDALVATTVIEVGIDNKNATFMIIEGANRFGLATLHQLRGRVGRGERQSYCVMINPSESKASNERLNFLEKTTDGFEVAMFDLGNRGGGEIIGTRQSGKNGFDVYKAMTENELFAAAGEAINDIMDDNTKENRKYLKYLKEKYDVITKDVTWN